jgi:hypothetical protein
MGESDNEEAHGFNGCNVAGGQFGRMPVVQLVESRIELHPVSSGRHLCRSLLDDLRNDGQCLRPLWHRPGRHDSRSRNVYSQPIN